MSVKELSWEEFLKMKSGSMPMLKLNVVTASMAPLIPVGSTVVVDTAAPYLVHDIIVFWHNKKLIVHILWSINRSVRRGEQEILVTRALNSKVVDTSINKEQILGRVINFKLSWFNLLNLYVIKRIKRY